ncbi:DUF4064 domain-containing protein [Chryseobacterium sp.]|uniref:DUF4064 domain-containing protein n=1 Tax=Chryseobacterium sp. TaxID=1871047 RepID=UPI002FC9E5D2
MNENKQISNVPMIMGIIGGVIGLPAAICSGACAAGMSSLADNSTEQVTNDAGNTFMWLGLIAAILGLTCAFLYKKNPKLWGAIMLFAGVLSGITLITFNFLSLIECVLFLIGGLLALFQKKLS